MPPKPPPKGTKPAVRTTMRRVPQAPIPPRAAGPPTLPGLPLPPPAPGRRVAPPPPRGRGRGR